MNNKDRKDNKDNKDNISNMSNMSNETLDTIWREGSGIAGRGCHECEWLSERHGRWADRRVVGQPQINHVR